MNQERLAEITALEAAATPGPWTWSAGMIEAPRDADGGIEAVLWTANIPGGHDDDDHAAALGACGQHSEEHAADNLAFLAQARTIVPELLEYVGELKHDLHGAGQCIDAYMTACARETAANERLTAEADRLRDAWQSAWAERNEARSAVAAVRELAGKWASEPTTIEAFLANEILKLVSDAAVGPGETEGDDDD